MEHVLHRLDESLEEFQQRWEVDFDRISAWADEILEQAACYLSRGLSGPESRGDLSREALQNAVSLAIASRTRPFLKEHQALTARLRLGIEELKQGGTGLGIVEQDLPRLSSRPLPMVTPLDGVVISQPGTMARLNPGARARHLRKELDEKIGPLLPIILEELQPRYRHWFLSTLSSLIDSFRLQTDPVCYRSSSRASAGSIDRLMGDIALLRALEVGGGGPA